MPSTSSPLSDLLAARMAQLEASAAAPLLAEAGARARIERLLLASDYAFERLRRHPGELAIVLGAAHAPPEPGEAEFAARLRRFRHASALAIAVRDLEGSDTIEATLAATSALADQCLQLALQHAELQLAERHGRLRTHAGEPQRLVVFALGKLGGGELNFSSDVDLVFGYPESGVSDGAAALDADAWCVRLGQRFIQVLSEVTAEGFVYRVDMRLRPFGNAGRLALSFGAMEQYFQREGRDWERYAWVKARPVAGDLVAGAGFLEMLRPFVFRRYLDYTAFEGLREMKGMIVDQVQRRDLAGDLKLGPGGIREIEFIAQLLQLIRGGREPRLRVRGLLAALDALVDLGHLAEPAARRLAAAYRFLRRLENHLQLLREEQTHVVPDDPLSRARLAAGMQCRDWEALEQQLRAHRAAVAAEFELVFDTPRRPAADLAAFAEYWAHIEEEDAAARLHAAGVEAVGELHPALLAFARSPAVLALSARARKRLDRVLPALLSAAASGPAPAATIARALKLLHAILRRSSYLALLAEQPAALTRVVEVMGASALLAERISQHPLLLDDLLDQRNGTEVAPSLEAVHAELAQALAGIDADDTGALLQALNEFHQSQAFRSGLACLSAVQPPAAAARQLAWVAQAIVARLLPLALLELARGHGQLPGEPPQGGLAVIGYGSFGGCELGFGSDLDLVFLFDGALVGRSSDGARPLEAPQYFARLMQRLVNLLGTLTPAGRLYEADLRLRPDGAKGVLVSTIESYAEYQRERAWTWEHQALVRARFVAGDPAMGARFAAIRADVLQRAREPAQLRSDVAAMRARMRGELDRSRAGSFDLKQGEGGLVDLEFLVQALVLQHAATHPRLAAHTATPALLESLAAAGVLAEATASELRQAHATLLQRALSCMLDGRPRLVAIDSAIEQARQQVRAACCTHGIVTG